MRRSLSALILALILPLVSASCATPRPWVPMGNASQGWFQQGQTLYFCRVTAYDKLGRPVPICVNAGVSNLRDLKKPYTLVDPTPPSAPAPPKEDQGR